MLAKHRIVFMFERKGMKLRTWAFSKGLSAADTTILYDISRNKIQGKWGRAKELRELLEKEGFLKAVDSQKELKKGA